MAFKVIVDLRDHELACQDNDSDEEDRLDGDGQDVDDGDTGLRHSLDDGEYDHSEDIVNDSRTDDDTGLTGVHELHVLDDTGGDTDGCGDHRGGHEHGVVHVPVHCDDERESRHEREDDSEDGCEERGLTGTEKVLDLGLESHCEQEEYDSQLCEGLDYLVGRARMGFWYVRIGNAEI